MVTIRVRDDGPYRVEGSVTLLDGEGGAFEVEEGEVVALCRCGHSEAKPFCDGSHRRLGFSSRPRATGPDQDEGGSAGG